MIYYFTPYHLGKCYGAAHNALCESVPNANDWICVMDGDMMFLRSDWGKQIDDVIKKHGNTYDVFGCLTNRLAGAHQQYQGQFSEDPDIRNHMAIANDCHRLHYDEVKETSVNVAAMLMIFKKSTWDAAKFPVNTMGFDRMFTDRVKKNGGKLAIMQGLYVFHLYRFGKENPTQFIDHLR